MNLRSTRLLFMKSAGVPTRTTVAVPTVAEITLSPAFQQGTATAASSSASLRLCSRLRLEEGGFEERTLSRLETGVAAGAGDEQLGGSNSPSSSTRKESVGSGQGKVGASRARPLLALRGSWCIAAAGAQCIAFTQCKRRGHRRCLQ